MTFIPAILNSIRTIQKCRLLSSKSPKKTKRIMEGMKQNVPPSHK